MIAVDTRGLQAFQRDLARYAKEARIPAAQAVEKKARDFGWRAYRIARALAPRRGEIRSAAEGRGFRVLVRPSSRQKALKRLKGKDSVKSRGKRLNQRALEVQYELSQRERSRGYSALVYGIARQIRPSAEGANFTLTKGNKKRSLGEWQVNTKAKNPEVKMESYQAGLGPVDRRYNITEKAMREVRADIGTYLARKQEERIAGTLKRRYR